MRTLVTAALVIAALTAPALAQKQKSIAPAGNDRPGEEARPIVDEKKYKAATESMGNRERNPAKVDPWATVRESKPAK